jgi:hypothetical protein
MGWALRKMGIGPNVNAYNNFLRNVFDKIVFVTSRKRWEHFIEICL